MEYIFWVSVGSLIYIYVGYGIFLSLINKLFAGRRQHIAHGENAFEPSVAVLIAAYNEASVIKDKIDNTRALDYPTDKIKIYVVSDGSDDRTSAIASSFQGVTVLHQHERKGKTAAINRAMPYISEDVTIFTDANVMINPHAIKNIVRHYQDPGTGGVSGEKVVLADSRAAAASTEGAYWRYESFLKSQDAQLSTIVGAAGEMFSIRTSMFEPIPEDSLLDDFMISMNIVRKGHAVKYEPAAYASEKPSFNISEEYKRKVRIAAGGIQSTLRNLDIMNPFKYGIVSFQFLTHRVSRWTIAPLLIITAFFSNLPLLHISSLYICAFILQIIFHSAALIGYMLSERQIRIKALSIPFYFDFMHYCVMAGWLRYTAGSQKTTWQKATRLSYN